MKIGVIDSGIGGLTVLRELIKEYPNNTYIYYGDTKNLPYGEKTKEELEILVNRIIEFLNKKQVDLIVFACGTISTTLNEKIKSNPKIIDVVTPTIDYVNSNFDKVGLIATTTTINSNYFQNNIKCELKTLNTPLLVPMIESGNIDPEIINNYMSYFDNETIILGCTHYPLIEKYIKNRTINMGTILTKYLTLSNDGNFRVNLYFSKIDNNLISRVKTILDCDYTIEEIR